MPGIITTLVAVAVLLSATSTATSTVKPPSPDITCSGTRVSMVLRECREGGYADTAASLRECVCGSLGIELDRCTLNCQSSTVQESPSTYSTGMTEGQDRNFDGEPQLPTMATVPPRTNQMQHAAGAIGGKAGIDIAGRLPKHNLQSQSKPGNSQRRKKAKKVAKKKPQSGLSSTSRKILGGIAVGVLVLVI